MPATKTRRNTKHPKLTAEDARTFEYESMASILQIEEAIAERAEAGIYPECECVPYEQTFNFNRWLAQGFSVKKGEKALRIQTFTPTGKTRKEQGEDGSESEKPILRPTIAFLFCRCQVQPKEAK
jgi:hypothetical protein